MRARNIKPGFFENDLLVEMPFEFRLLFIGLWTMADKSGRLEDRPKKIKMCVFPADDVDVNRGLTELHRYGFIERYEIDGLKFIQVVNWKKHQKPHHTEKESVIPPCPNGDCTVNPRNHNGGNRPDSLIPDSLIPDSLIPDSGLLDNKSGSQPDGAKKKTPAKTPAVYSQDFEAFWEAYPARNGQKTKKAKAWDAFWKITTTTSISPEHLTDRIKALAPQYGDFPRDAVTWLNQRGWEDEVVPVKLRPSTGSKVDRAIANGQEWLAMQEIHQ